MFFVGWSGYHIPMESICDSKDVLPHVTSTKKECKVNNNCNFTVKETGGLLQNALQFKQGSLVVSNWSNNTCVGDVHLCTFGFSVSFWVYFDAVHNNLSQIFSNALTTQSSSSSSSVRGLDIHCQAPNNNYAVQCFATFKYSSAKLETEFTITNKHWVHLVVTWHTFQSLQVIINGHLLLVIPTNITLSSSSKLSDGTVVIGALDSPHEFYVDDLKMFDRYLDEEEARKLFGKLKEIILLI